MVEVDVASNIDKEDDEENQEEDDIEYRALRIYMFTLN